MREQHHRELHEVDDDELAVLLLDAQIDRDEVAALVESWASGGMAATHPDMVKGRRDVATLDVIVATFQAEVDRRAEARAGFHALAEQVRERNRRFVDDVEAFLADQDGES